MNQWGLAICALLILLSGFMFIDDTTRERWYYRLMQWCLPLAVVLMLAILFGFILATSDGPE